MSSDLEKVDAILLEAETVAAREILNISTEIRKVGPMMDYGLHADWVREVTRLDLILELRMKIKSLSRSSLEGEC